MRLFKGLTGNVLNFQIGRKTKREKNGANCAHDVKNVQRVKRGFFLRVSCCKFFFLSESQIEGPRLHGAEVLPRLLRHLQRRPSLAARDHVPPDVDLKRAERLKMGPGILFHA